MAGRFAVLASGSSGNASVVVCDDFALLIDCGLQPKILADRLFQVGLKWADIRGVVLSHVHGDHWNPYTLAHLRQLNVPIYTHAQHHVKLDANPNFEPLKRAGLARTFEHGEPIRLSERLTCTPVRVPHDADPTFGFRVEAAATPLSPGWALGYASDVGHPTAELAERFAGVAVLALEYNHDVALQKASGRHPVLVSRVLGKHGHLSNDQAARLTEAVAGAADPAGFRCLVQLHLSRDCNTRDLARQAAQKALAQYAPAAQVLTATQDEPTAVVPLPGRPLVYPGTPPRPLRSVQLTLPGFDTELPEAG